MIAIVDRLGCRMQNYNKLLLTAKLQHIKSGLQGFLTSSVLVQNMFHCYTLPMTEYSEVKESCKRNIKIFNKAFLSRSMLTCSSSVKIKFAKLQTGDIELNGCIHLCLVLSLRTAFSTAKSPPDSNRIICMILT